MGVLVAAVLVSLRPKQSAELVGLLGRGVVRFWPSLLLVVVAGLLLATSAGLRAAPSDGSKRRNATPALPLLVHVALLLGLATALAFAIGVLLWRTVGQSPLTSTPRTPTTASTPAAPSASPAPVVPVTGPVTGWTVQDTFDAMKIVLAVVGGIGGVVALTIAYRRQHLGEVAEYREDTKLFTDRFATAAKLLGDEQAAVRLAGVYAVAALADDWPAGRQTCIDVLCAYLRMPYTPPDDDAVTRPAGPVAIAPAASVPERMRAWLRRSSAPPHPLTPAPTAQDKPNRDPHEERQVRHTVIRLIRDHLRLPAQHAHTWQRYQFDFTGAVFDGGDFSEACFSGSHVSFYEARFTGGWLDFKNVKFIGGKMTFEGALFAGSDVNFANAEFTGGLLQFASAKFSDGGVDFGGAMFSGSDVYFFGTEFCGGGADFGGAIFSGGEVNFWHAMFSDPRAGLAFDRAVFSGGRVSFRGAVFSGGTVDLSQPNGWTTPPRFDAWNDGPPAGLLLPPGWQPPGSAPGASANTQQEPNPAT